MSSIAISAGESMWEVIRVYGDVFKYENKQTFVVNAVLLSCEKKFIKHNISIRFPKSSHREDITKEDLTFKYNNNRGQDEKNIQMQIFKCREISFDELSALRKYFELPDLTNFEIEYVPFFSNSVYCQNPDTRDAGVVQMIVEEGLFPNQTGMAIFGMEIYANCTVSTNI